MVNFSSEDCGYDLWSTWMQITEKNPQNGRQAQRLGRGGAKKGDALIEGVPGRELFVW